MWSFTLYMYHRNQQCKVNYICAKFSILRWSVFELQVWLLNVSFSWPWLSLLACVWHNVPLLHIRHPALTTFQNLHHVGDPLNLFCTWWNFPTVLFVYHQWHQKWQHLPDLQIQVDYKEGRKIEKNTNI